MSSDLDKMIPTTTKVPIGDDEVEVRPIKVGQLPAVLRAIQPFQHFFVGGWENVDRSTLFDLIAHHTEAVLDLVAAALNRPLTWVKDRELDELVNLLTTVIEVNLDFFTRNVLPLLSGAAAKVKQGINTSPTPGQTVSND